jgi:probable F420-dependent oxidoreductase
MEIGVFAPLSNPFATPDYLRALGPACEERGFRSIWVAEHVVLFDEYASRYPYSGDGKLPAGGENGVLEPFTTLAFLAANTVHIRLGTGIALIPQRNPVYAAKEAANVDWVSQGRLDLGVGVGWLEEEFAALGVPFARRGARCRAYLEVMRRLWCDPVSEYHGEFYDLPSCRQYPKPVQKPHPPLHFGGESEAALRRVADLGQGWYGYSLEPEAAATHVAALTKLLEERGRRREEIQVSICPYAIPHSLDLVKRYRDAGVDQVILMLLARNADALRSALDGVAKEIVEPARGL